MFAAPVDAGTAGGIGTDAWLMFRPCVLNVTVVLLAGVLVLSLESVPDVLDAAGVPDSGAVDFVDAVPPAVDADEA